MTLRVVSPVIVEPMAGLLVVLRGEPLRWEHAELLRHIAHTVREAFGERLQLSKRTEWVGLSPELKAGLGEVLAEQ